MVRHVLVPVDGSTKSKKALEFALREFPDSELTALHVIDPVEGIPDMGATTGSFSEAQQQRADEVLDEAAGIARQFDRAIETESKTGKPSTEILTTVEDAGVDHVVMGSQGRSGFSRILMGSVAETVLRRAPVPVTIVR